MTTPAPLFKTAAPGRTTVPELHLNTRYTGQWTTPGGNRCRYDCLPGTRNPVRHLNPHPRTLTGFRIDGGNPSLQFDPEIAHGFRRAHRRRSAKRLASAARTPGAICR